MLGQEMYSLNNILRQARGVLAMDGGTSSDPYCKVVVLSFNSLVSLSLVFLIIVSHYHLQPIMLSRKVTLGKEKHRSKTINNTLNPKWREGMDLNW